MNLSNLLNPQKQKAYQEHLKQSGYSQSTQNRKKASINKFFGWAKESGYIDPNASPTPTPTPDLSTNLVSEPESIPFYKRFSPKTMAIAGTSIVGLAAVSFFLIRLNFPGALNTSSSAKSDNLVTPQNPIVASSGELGNWVINFSAAVTAGRFEENSTKPLNEPGAFVFKLYDSPSGGTPLWTSSEKNLSPDVDGNIATSLGGPGDTPVPPDYFFSKKDLFIAVSTNNGPELPDRHRVSTASIAANAEQRRLGRNSAGY